MRLIDRYLLRELLAPLGYCLGGFLLFYVSFDLIFQMGRFQDAHLPFVDIVKYYGATLPQVMADQVIPVALLLALLYALTNHSRHNELTAMRAAGVGVWRLALPYLAVGAALGGLVFAINEAWAPRADERAREIMESHKERATPRGFSPRVEFNNDADRRHWNITSFNRATGELIQPTITCELRGGARVRIFAQSATWSNSRWFFCNAEIWTNAPPRYPTSTNVPALTLDLPETPEWDSSEIKVARSARPRRPSGRSFRSRRFAHYLHFHPKMTAEKRAMFETQLQGRFAEPFTCLAVALDRVSVRSAIGAAECVRRRGQQHFHLLRLFFPAANFVRARHGELHSGGGGRVAAERAFWRRGHRADDEDVKRSDE